MDMLNLSKSSSVIIQLISWHHQLNPWACGALGIRNAVVGNENFWGKLEKGSCKVHHIFSISWYGEIQKKKHALPYVQHLSSPHVTFFSSCWLFRTLKSFLGRIRLAHLLFQRTLRPPKPCKTMSRFRSWVLSLEDTASGRQINKYISSKIGKIGWLFQCICKNHLWHYKNTILNEGKGYLKRTTW